MHKNAILIFSCCYVNGNRVINIYFDSGKGNILCLVCQSWWLHMLVLERIWGWLWGMECFQLMCICWRILLWKMRTEGLIAWQVGYATCQQIADVSTLLLFGALLKPPWTYQLKFERLHQKEVRTCFALLVCSDMLYVQLSMKTWY